MVIRKLFFLLREIFVICQVSKVYSGGAVHSVIFFVSVIYYLLALITFPYYFNAVIARAKLAFSFRVYKQPMGPTRSQLALAAQDVCSAALGGAWICWPDDGTKKRVPGSPTTFDEPGTGTGLIVRLISDCVVENYC
jgi:hypothetical protein